LIITVQCAGYTSLRDALIGDCTVIVVGDWILVKRKQDAIKCIFGCLTDFHE
jgi:hypothetical protein